jgi:hypothetical protein
MGMDRKDNPSPKKETRTTGLVLDDGAIIELLYDPVTRQTAFAVGRDGEISIADYVELPDGHRLVPYSPENNLIKHEAVLLPSKPESYESEADLISHVQSFIHRHVDLSPVFEKTALHYILLSWLYDAFNELPYIRLQGDYGTGKTRALLVLGAIAYKPFFASGASTVSPLFHTLDAFRGTLIFDEADFRLSDEKAEVVKILNNGNVRGIPVLRTMMNQKREFNPQAFHVFGPKIVATRGSYEDRALESRFLTEVMGGRPLRPDIPINLNSSFKEEALAIRNRLLSYRFHKRHTVSLNPALLDSSLEPRQNQILIPLLSVIDDAGQRAAIVRNAQELRQALVAESGVSPEAHALTVLMELMQAQPDAAIPLRAIAELAQERFAAEYDRPLTARYISSVLRKRLHLKTYKSMGVYCVPTSEAGRITLLAERYGLLGDTGEEMPGDLGT